MNVGTMAWADAEVQELKRLWKTGDSASVIGRAMGKTRNAILGKVHRLELEARPMGRRDYDAEPKIVRDCVTRPKRVYRRSVITSREIKPKLRIVDINRKPALLAVMSPITGAYMNTRRVRPPEPEYTKNQLRAQLTEALRNTARMA